ncbi:MAG TPA: DEAD/DEAH box helicase [Bacteroidales bacterium]|nr:DEAD/DEAH box helicase [Bacteroidales bacterium]
MKIFTETGLNNELLRAINRLGFEKPTPIQEKIIPNILNSDNDIIGLAQTGTGKTAGFGLPLIQKTDIGKRSVQSLILCPTRELCMQITSDLKDFAYYTKGLSAIAIYGGTNISPQIQALKKGAHIIIGTPGRTLDLIRRGILKINGISTLILDEADEMLNMGFKEDLDAILKTTPEGKQTLLFSATMPDDVRRIADNYMNSLVEITAGRKNSGAENILHHYYVVKASNRYPALKRIADINTKIYGIVFCRTRNETKDVADRLIQDGYNADALHGELSQSQRDHVMQRFRNRSLQLLIATDVAARGIDVSDLSHIINYNLPDDPEVYLHRSGRTGRAGKSGICISITHSREGRRIKELEHVTGKKFQYKIIPGGREICERRLFNLIDNVENVDVDESKIESFMPSIYKKLEWLGREDLIKHFVSVEFNRFLEYYRNAPDLNIVPEKDLFIKKGRGNKTTYTNIYINIGSKRGMNPSNLIALVNEAMRKRDISIGKIDVQRSFSFFEIDREYDQKLLSAFDGAIYEDQPVIVEIKSGNKNIEAGRKNGYSPHHKPTGNKSKGKKRKKHK